MSYARFGPNCDVYVYLDEAGTLNCCGCRLQDHRVVGHDGSDIGWHREPVGEPVPTTFTTTSAMLSHLEAHWAAGHVVPVSVYDDLRAESTENDAWCREQSS